MIRTSTLLTPNRRLSATLHKRYQLQQQINSACWTTPDILPLSSWIQRLWLENSYDEATPYLLNTTQEQHIWETIICQSKESAHLLQITETADLAKSAWGLLKQWRVNLHSSEFTRTEDYAALKNWMKAFERICTQHNWIDANSMTDLLIEKINSGIALPQTITLAGFTELSPQMTALMNACEAKGVLIDPHTETPCNDITRTFTRLTAENSDQEIQLMARWAKSIFDNNEVAIIGCVIPNLDKVRDRTRQIFTDVFDKQTTAFNISAGKRLSEFHIIHAALQLLSLNKKVITRETLSYLLTTPFMGAAENERIKRALLDRSLRQQNMSKMKLDALDSTLSNCPKFIKLFKNYLQSFNEYTDLATYKEWAQRICNLLTAWGWPGERSLNSEEYQTVDAWQTALNELTTLDYVTKPVNFFDAQMALKRIISNHIFQAKTPETRVQVLGVLEAAGSPFDYLWVAGMDDLAWPPQPKPHPFIPKSLQRELNMPHATADRELSFCTTVTKQFKENARQIIFSYAKEDEELERQVSPLIRDLPEITQDEFYFADYLSPPVRVFQSKKIQVLVDNQAPPLREGEKVHGGVGIIKKQAMCAFKAFAEYRLHAHELENPLLGLRKKDRGELIHKVMETVWDKLTDYATLLNTANEDLLRLINDSIQHAFDILAIKQDDAPHYFLLEKMRLEKLVWQWLQIEKSRPPFKISNNEKSSTITLNQLTLTVRIDRIDQLMDGRKLIIDYKTGKNNNTQSWLDERPDEPQLPLYALLEPENTFGLAFAQLYPGKYLFAGLSQHDIEIKGIKPHLQWQQQLDAWRSILNKLSDQFYQGVAVVDPKDPATTCAFCALQPLCRVNESI